jgi:hypothetical protein
MHSNLFISSNICASMKAIGYNYMPIPLIQPCTLASCQIAAWRQLLSTTFDNKDERR